jgi:hypothetical protein
MQQRFEHRIFSADDVAQASLQVIELEPDGWELVTIQATDSRILVAMKRPYVVPGGPIFSEKDDRNMLSQDVETWDSLVNGDQAPQPIPDV